MVGDTEVTNSADVIDSRDVIARIEYLTDERDAFTEDAEVTTVAGEERPTWELGNPEDAAELAALVALAEEASGYAADWTHGETLIRDSYFEEYAQQLADDLGMLKDAAQWPYTCIDWKQAAEELQQDYTSVEFDGVTYWVR